MPLSKAGFGVVGQVIEGDKHLLCVTDNAIRVLDKATGNELRRYESSLDIDGADYWGSLRIAICLGGVGKGSRTIQVIDSADFRVLSEFKISKAEVAYVEVVGDVLLLGALYRNMGVDLLKEEVIWEVGQWHKRIHDNLIYYGKHHYDEDTKKGYRVLGVCDPVTGEQEILYSELIPSTLSIREKLLILLLSAAVILTVAFLIRYVMQKKDGKACVDGENSKNM